jgi:hypothetical protein
VAKNVVAAGLARQCQVQVSYAIGVAKPINITVYTEGTGVIPDEKIAELVMEHFDLRPKGIVQMLDLLRPIYQPRPPPTATSAAKSRSSPGSAPTRQKTGSDPRRFPGKNPLSEPESRWVNEEIDRFKPDVIISVHAPFGVLDFDGPAPVPQRFGLLRFNRVGVYPGSLGNYLGLYKNTPVITLELPNAQTMPPTVEVQRIWADMLAWIRQNVNQETAARQAVKPAPARS